MTVPADAPRERWHRALLVAQLLALDPPALGGVVLSVGPEAVRDMWLDALTLLLPPDARLRKMPLGIEDDRLIGAIDLPATLAKGRPVVQKGLLAEVDGGLLLLPSAERVSAGAAARIAHALDNQSVAIEREGLAQRLDTRFAVVAFDEASGPDEQVPAALRERLAFHLDLRGLSARGLALPSAIDRTAARAGLREVAPASAAILSAMVATADSLGIASVVPALLALRVARAAAALAGRREILEADAVLAVELVLAPRARQWPPDSEQDSESDSASEPDAPERDQRPPDLPPESQPDDDQGVSERPSLEEILLAAVQAALPPGLIQQVQQAGPTRSSAGPRAGAGTAQQSPRRGRPAGVRAAALRPGLRLALVETLRAAAPWQTLRRRDSPVATPPRILVRAADFRVKKFLQRRESTLVFCVDASGSAAFQRLAETKGAVELLLADAYVARTSAALVVFRGKGAELLLPPTRSLSRAKALLATLPGGGGTPLAAGIDLAVQAALAERAKGREPLILLLTDGRANIGRDGQADRGRAMAEATVAAQQIKLYRLAAVFIDTAPRPRPEAAQLALTMGGRYVALPYVEAGAVRDVAVTASAALGGNAFRRS